MKLQILADAKTSDIICIAFSNGKTHDFNLFKGSKLHICPTIELLADKGYLGILQLHKNSTLPVKASKNHKLTAVEKAYNRMVSKRRIYIEHTIDNTLEKHQTVPSQRKGRRREQNEDNVSTRPKNSQ